MLDGISEKLQVLRYFENSRNPKWISAPDGYETFMAEKHRLVPLIPYTYALRIVPGGTLNIGAGGAWWYFEHRRR